MENFIGEIRCFPYPNLVPSGWHLCDGSLLPISSNAALYSLIGTNYGGDGRSTFALPDLRGRVMVGHGQVPSGIHYEIGNYGGLENVTLSQNQMPPHSHSFGCVSTAGATAAPLNNTFSSAGTNATMPTLESLYVAPGGNSVPLNPASLSTAGGNGGHHNMQPFLVTGLYIALKGLYPQRS